MFMQDPFPNSTEINSLIDRAWGFTVEKETLLASVGKKPTLNITS